ncbi:MAG TPA: galactose-1-phosphate uridylyltransferase [Pirellulales bacterium]|jgi:UDPglucose--hexose-1-phosphate uridylyltransferase|nr:galactose-1-phosphate uridylyltransferase [Pirellulales bacterium]
MLPEIRKDPLSGRWVIVAPDRAVRPQDLLAANQGEKGLRPCPFCPGCEEDTPNEVLALRAPGALPNDPNWRVRVIPNKFPAVIPDVPPAPLVWPELRSNGLPGVSLPGRGVHEVVIESRRHLHSNTQQSNAELAEVLAVYRQRLRQLETAGEWRYGLIFKNVGFAAGASLEHLHSQLVALPIIPAAIEEALRATYDYYQEHGRCYFCDLIQQEQRQAIRVVAESPGFIAICPFASRFAYETWIIPKSHAAGFSAAADESLSDLAQVLRSVLLKLERGLDQPAYNFAIRTVPFDRLRAEHYHWHIEVFPRLTRLAGFELSTDFYINIARPEDAATLLRQA